MLFHISKADEAIIRKHTPWIVSPVEKETADSEGPTLASDNNGDTKQIRSHKSNDSSILAEGAILLKSHVKANAIELFYDLFFVANLTTFTVNHEISNGENLKSYLGFFTLMWFTWLQTSFFDVRFSFDSVFDRVCKAISFGIMTGFAVVSPVFIPQDIDISNPILDTSFAFRAMALILMVSRLAFMGQYFVVLWFARGYPHTYTPLILSITVHFIAAMVFLGTYWAFPSNGHGKNNSAYAAWYTIVVVEALAIVTITVRWKEIDFRKTNLIERVGLLTLIIIGEGVIGMTQSVGLILNNTHTITGQTIGVIVAAVLLIYFVWVLYFDQIDDDRFGVLRQPFWAVLHFPLHVAILLTLEGSTQFIVWNQIVQNLYWLRGHFYHPTLGESSTTYVNSLTQNLTTFSDRFRLKIVAANYNFTMNLTALADLDLQTLTGKNESLIILDEMYTGLTEFIFKNYGVIQAPINHCEEYLKCEPLEESFTTFEVVFFYYLISAGTLLFVLGTMYFLGTKRKSLQEYCAVILRLAGGIGLSLMVLSYTSPVSSDLLLSPWMIPLVVMVYFAVIVLDNILMWAWARGRFGDEEMHQIEDA